MAPPPDGDPAPMSNRYVVATLHAWNIEPFRRLAPHLPGEWTLITEPASLTPAVLERLAPRYVFFPHWSSRVPDGIIEAHECVCFHMADLPYGRGGTPLQNLIASGHRFTRMSALRMVHELDAGPVYMKRTFSLEGSAEEIYRRAGLLAFDMMGEIAEAEPRPVPQQGEVTVFRRRRPEESRLPEGGTCEAMYDHIRMLDAPGYPHAFLDHGRWRLSFTQARQAAGGLVAEVTITDRRGGEASDA